MNELLPTRIAAIGSGDSLALPAQFGNDSGRMPGLLRTRKLTRRG